MYGGLFGDLPAAKKDGKAQEEESTKDNDKEIDVANDREAPASTNTTPKKSAAPAFLFPPRAQKRPKITTGKDSTTTEKPKQQSIVGSLGKVGTSMAFVPQAALKKKKPNRFAKLLETPNIVAPSSDTAKDGAEATKLKDPPPSSCQQSQATATSSTTSPSFQPHEMAVTTTIVSKQPADTSKVIDIHQQSTSTQQSDDNPPLHAAFPPPEHLHSQNDAEEITDPYDPYVPNDLLQYWERQAAAQERAKLEQETREAMERQRVLREQLQRERQELLQKGSAGQDTTAVAAAMGGMGRGRGRGRGLSNLPAWLIEKQRKEAAEGLGSGGDTGK